MDPFNQKIIAKGFAAQWYHSLYWLIGNREPSLYDLEALNKVIIKLLQSAMDSGIMTPIGDCTDLAIEKVIEIRYNESDGRLWFTLPEPQRTEMFELIKEGSN